MPDPKLIIDSVEDFVDEEPKQSEFLYRLVGSERTRGEDWKCLPLVGRLPPVLILAYAENSRGDFNFLHDHQAL